MSHPPLLFLTGLHRSGTSLVHRLLRAHPDVSGFTDTGVPEDEGQHLQAVYPPASAFGGPGRFAFDPDAAMDEHHPLARPDVADAVLRQWAPWLDERAALWVEKSPPTLIRTRFFQALFPRSRFVVLLRHPLTVALATEKWSRTPVSSLVDHTLVAYERFAADLPRLAACYVLRYESLVEAPQETMRQLFDFAGLAPMGLSETVRPDVNAHYLERWQARQRGLWGRWRCRLPRHLARRALAFGYRLDDPAALLPSGLLGAHRGATA